MCVSVNDAKTLCYKAKQLNLILMVGHIFLYHPAIVEIKKMIEDDELGEVHTIHSRRLNWGRVRQDENAFSSLSPHDISIMLYLFGEMPLEVIASGITYLQKDIEDAVIVSLKFPGNKIGFIHVSWIDPKKERSTTIIGSRKAAVFDDMAKDSKLVIYQEGRKTSCPTFPKVELLALECQHFIDCIRNNQKPLSDGQNGLDVVQIIEATQKAIQTHSAVSIKE
jgi:predicted dehydrogenase